MNRDKFLQMLDDCGANPVRIVSTLRDYVSDIAVTIGETTHGAEYIHSPKIIDAIAGQIFVSRLHGKSVKTLLAADSAPDTVTMKFWDGEYKLTLSKC